MQQVNLGGGVPSHLPEVHYCLSAEAPHCALMCQGSCEDEEVDDDVDVADDAVADGRNASSECLW